MPIRVVKWTVDEPRDEEDYSMLETDPSDRTSVDELTWLSLSLVERWEKKSIWYIASCLYSSDQMRAEHKWRRTSCLNWFRLSVVITNQNSSSSSAMFHWISTRQKDLISSEFLQSIRILTESIDGDVCWWNRGSNGSNNSSMMRRSDETRIVQRKLMCQSRQVWSYEMLQEIVTEVMNEILMNFMHNSTVSKRMIGNLSPSVEASQLSPTLDSINFDRLVQFGSSQSNEIVCWPNRWIGFARSQIRTSSHYRSERIVAHSIHRSISNDEDRSKSGRIVALNQTLANSSWAEKNGRSHQWSNWLVDKRVSVGNRDRRNKHQWRAEKGGPI